MTMDPRREQDRSKDDKESDQGQETLVFKQCIASPHNRVVRVYSALKGFRVRKLLKQPPDGTLMARTQTHRHWLIAGTSTLGVLLIIFGLSHLLLATGMISPLSRNGINKIHVTCDGVRAEISTQRYYGFEDFDVGTRKEFADLPIASPLRCNRASVDIERRADLLDRFTVNSSCDGTILGTAGIDSISCNGTLRVEVRRA